jgi:two-component system sensor histidine kinase MprB
MSFRLRITLLVALAVAVAVAGASTVVYFTDRHQLISQVDKDLLASRDFPPIFNRVFRGPAPVYGRPTGAPPRRAESVRSRNVVVPAGPFKIVLPRTLKAVQVSLSPAPLHLPRPTKPQLATRTLGGVPSRVLTYSIAGTTVRISTSLVDVQRNLSHLRWLLALICLGGVAVAAGLGAVVSRAAVAPLRRLTETTETILETGDLSRRTGEHGRDEVSRLSARLDELLAMLETSLGTQRQLVADASHELRTPITTLRANLELLATPGTLDDAERAELLADVQDELESMTSLVTELIELARGEELDVAPREFRLDEVVRGAVERTAKRAPGVAFHTELEASTVAGVPERVERAIINLLDNACKWSPPGETVDVAVHGGMVEVRDRGPGIPPDDLPLIFNRFYRSPEARGMPGAGLGLAIVKQIADAHGGSASADRAPDGGAILRLSLSSNP